MVVFCLQTWIDARITTDAGYWHWDLSDLFATEHEAETIRLEFFFDDLCRIVKMELSEVEVVGCYQPVPEEAEKTAAQKMLF